MHWRDPRAGSRPDESPPDEPDQLDLLVLRGLCEDREEAARWIEGWRAKRQSHLSDPMDDPDSDNAGGDNR
jgi:hypothetical protein